MAKEHPDPNLNELLFVNLGASRRHSGVIGREVADDLAVASGANLRYADHPSAFRTGLAALIGPFW